MKWYVVQTKPTAEENVRLHLKNAEIEAFLPRIRQSVRGKRRSTRRIKSLFPSYLFVHLNLDDPAIHHMLRFTRGVRKILGDGERPVPVPEQMIDIIRERVDGEGVIEQGLRMKRGDRVRIRGGVFDDLVGILEKPATAAGRVRVLLKIMHHQVKCELSASEVERAD